MAEIKGIKGVRFSENAGSIEQLCCPPYDIISDEQREQFIARNEHNVIRLELPRGERPYDEAGEVFRRWMDEGVLRRDEESLYVYEEEFTAYGHTMRIKGIICCVKLEEFSKGIVLPHEETLSKAKEDRLNLMKATSCNFSQIYSLYIDNGNRTRPKVDHLSAGAPDMEFADEAGVIHRLWACSEPAQIAAIAGDFGGRKLYIADGHHRYETAINYRNYLREQGLAKEGDPCDYVMMMLVEMENEGLVVFPTHRLIRDLPDFDAEKLCAAAGEYFDIQSHNGVSSIMPTLDAYYRKGAKAFAMYTGGDEWKLLLLRSMDSMKEIMPDCSEALRGLDVSVLHSLVLERSLGIDKQNMAAQKNLTYTRSFEEAIERTQNGEFQCAFILNPTRVTEIRDVAAAGEKMPQKSTYFYPKLITGLVMNLLK
ncbi:MAG: DUF1015 domain-containing protein [Ruminococcaceae bacterium]|nr:DUF1015 domain-containing protein [Oscillospiraceae bacterium]